MTFVQLLLIGVISLVFLWPVVGCIVIAVRYHYTPVLFFGLFAGTYGSMLIGFVVEWSGLNVSIANSIALVALLICRLLDRGGRQFAAKGLVPRHIVLWWTLPKP